MNLSPICRCFGWFASTAALAFVLVLALPTNAASEDPEHWRSVSLQVISQITIADFDGDHRPDLATIQISPSNSSNARYWIDFLQSTGLRQTLSITAPSGGLRIASRDVNGDTYPDVILTTAWTNRPVAVLLNDGLGHFKNSDPSMFPQAFSTPENSWRLRDDEVKDSSAALFSRCFSGDCQEVGGVFSFPNATASLSSHSPHFATFRAVACSLGRAPPSFANLS